MADLRIVDAPVLLQESITDDVKMPTGGLGNFSIRLGDIVWYVVTKEQLANKNYVDLSSKGVKDSLDIHIADKNNPHKVTKIQVGLGNVDNTADIDKPVSNAVNSAIITATTDMATKSYVNQKDNLKADKATTLSGYGITDAYTKTDVDSKTGDLSDLKTADKTNLVKAINEVNDATKGVVEIYNKNTAGANGWDANLIAYGEITQKQINDGLESIAQLLSIKNPRDGMRVYVKSYRAGLGVGGDTFDYDSTKANINDGVVTFNGWVRDTSDKLLTTDDAGLLGDDTDTNATTRLQSLFSAVDDGFTLQIKGKYVTTTHLIVRNVDNLTITGVAGEIVGDKDNWVFGSPLLATTVTRGIILGHSCRRINVNNLKIKGVQLNNTLSNADKWQDGDCAIQLISSDNATVEKNDCSNTFAWSILIDQSDFPVVRDNKISDVTHQSGINCVVNQSDNNFAVVCDNIIDNVGLYGIEWETYSGSLSMQCYNNTITNCWVGIAVVSTKELYGFISNNNIFASSLAGLYIRASNLNNNLNVVGNNVSHSFRGVLLQSSNGMLVSENKLLGSYNRQVYQKIASDAFICRIAANNKFLMERSQVSAYGLGAGSVLSVDAKKTITITSVEDSSEVFANMALKLITIAETTLTDDDVFKQLHRIRASGGRAEAGIETEGSQKNILISKNVSTDFNYPYQKQTGDSTDSSFNELVVDNVFSGAGVNSIMNLVPTKGIYYRGNTVSGGVPRLTREVIEGGYVDLKPLQTNVLNISRTSGATHPTATIGVFKGVSLVGVYVRPIGASTTGAMSILINGTSYAHSSVGASARVIACQCNIKAGNITIQLSDSVGDLVYSNVEITLLTM